MAVRAVVQRVGKARVTVEGELVGEIGVGLLVYLGAGRQDGQEDLAYVVDKVAGLRVFPNEEGKMARSVAEAEGQILVVSQFTLFGDVRRGRRPSFDDAADPVIAEVLYEEAVARWRSHHGLQVQTGRFRSHMQVEGQVDGPVTILLDSRKTF